MVTLRPEGSQPAEALTEEEQERPQEGNEAGNNLVREITKVARDMEQMMKEPWPETGQLDMQALGATVEIEELDPNLWEEIRVADESKATKKKNRAKIRKREGSSSSEEETDPEYVPPKTRRKRAR